jgi:predicted nucleic acid-binding protein
MRCFVDTNVLVYARDSKEPSKQKTASKWLEALSSEGALVLSAQSLREFYAVGLRRDRSDAAVRRAREEVDRLLTYVPETLFTDRLGDAWMLQDDHRLSFWDALLVASALAADCSIFLSEDMNAGQKIKSLIIVNPFSTTPASILGG